MKRSGMVLAGLMLLAAGGVKAAPVPVKAAAFDLADVELLESPFSRAMELDRRYLLSLPPARLLHTFRINAGITSSAEPLGGWEAPDCELRGHFVGHYLSGCALMVRATGDKTLKANAAEVVRGLAECQAKFANGYLSAYPESFFDRLEKDGKVWAPWYTLHKVYQGLVDQYTLCGNAQALEVLERAMDWVGEREGRLSDEQMQKTLDVEHGGMNDVLTQLYSVTGKEKYLKLAQRFNHHRVLDPLMRGEDRLDGLHANTQFPKVIGITHQYEMTGDAKLREAAEFFWNVVTKERSYVTGGNSDGEHFSRKAELSKHMGPATTETCNTYNMLKLTQALYETEPRAAYMDYYERAVYNHILASQHPHTGMTTYYLPIRNGMARGDGKPFGFCTPFSSFWCCTGTGVENHAKYGGAIYAHDGAQTLYVNLFVPSELEWKEAGVRVRQETRYPEEGKTRLVISAKEPREFAINIRRPWWATKEFGVKINGQSRQWAQSPVPGSYDVEERVWKDGDVVEVTMPMSLRLEGFRDDPNRVAVVYGPLVLAAETDSGDVVAGAVTAEKGKVLEAIKPVEGKVLTFEASGEVFRRGTEEGKGTVKLAPFYSQYEKPQVVYWDVTEPAKWEAQAAERKEAERRRKELAALTIDEIKFTRESEREHNLASERSSSGDIYGHRWRDARDGGWFAFDLKVLPDVPVRLGCTFWGPDSGGREFDIFVDDVKVATLKLDGRWGGGLHDEVYPVPAEVTKGKEKVRVTFQAHPGMMAGGSFGVRTLKPGK